MSDIDPQIIEIFTAHKDELAERFSVESIAIFGSVAKGAENPDSDIDILIRFKNTPGLFGFIDLKQYLETISGRTIDLVTENALKKQMRDDILKEAVLVA